MSHHDVYAIGNALVDSEYQVTDAQLLAAGVAKRHMTLIDASRRAELLNHVHGIQAHRTGGGSAGNTVVAVAQLGGHAFYSCRVADDELGDFYTQDLLAHGVATTRSSRWLFEYHHTCNTGARWFWSMDVIGPRYCSVIRRAQPTNPGQESTFSNLVAKDARVALFK